MHVKAKKMAFGGLLLALTILCMSLGSLIESNTLFLLAAASYFVGIVIRETGLGTGLAFYAGAVLLGFLITPNKFYVISYAGLGFYILATELAWCLLGRFAWKKSPDAVFWIIKYGIFNLLYLPVVFFFPKLIFAGELGTPVLVGAVAAGQAVLFLYDKAYDYVQSQIWSKLRRHLF